MLWNNWPASTAAECAFAGGTFDIDANAVPVRLASILQRPEMRAVRRAFVLCPWYYGQAPSYDAHAALPHFDTTGYDHLGGR
jgi:hypothetical protein